MKQFAQVMPLISVDSVDLARDFYVEKLGFSQMMGVIAKDGEFSFCTVVLNGGKVMFSRPQEKSAATAAGDSKRPVQIYFEVEDVDAYYEEAKKKGARPTPLTTQWWGDRTFTVTDPFGYLVWFYQTVAEPVPPEGAKLV